MKGLGHPTVHSPLEGVSLFNATDLFLGVVRRVVQHCFLFTLSRFSRIQASLHLIWTKERANFRNLLRLRAITDPDSVSHTIKCESRLTVVDLFRHLLRWGPSLLCIAATLRTECASSDVSSKSPNLCEYEGIRTSKWRFHVSRCLRNKNGMFLLLGNDKNCFKDT